MLSWAAEAAGQETEPGIRVLERGKAGGQTAYPTSLHASLMSSAQAAGWDVCWECLCRTEGAVGYTGEGKEEDGSRRMRHIPLGTSSHSGFFRWDRFCDKAALPNSTSCRAWNFNPNFNSNHSLPSAGVGQILNGFWVRWSTARRNRLCRPSLSDIQTLWKWHRPGSLGQTPFHSTWRTHHRSL